MSLVIAGALGVAAYLLVRALAVESRPPTSAWREATFGPSQPSIDSNSRHNVLRRCLRFPGADRTS